MSLERCQAETNSAHFSEWIAYNNIDPFTVNRVEYMLSVVCAILANANRAKGTAAHSPADFLPKFEKSSKPDGKDLEIKLRALLHGNN